jgi:NAD+ diphosphatase
MSHGGVVIAKLRWMERRNIFAGPYLDRSAHLRQDPSWFEAALGDPQSRVVPVWQSRSLVTADAAPRAVLLGLDALPPACRPNDDLILLGRFGEHSCFAYEFESISAPRLAAGAEFQDLRLVSSRLTADEAGLLGYARAMILWRRRHRFCGTCGGATVPARSGHAVVCSNASCRTEQFPRIDPAIIVLVSDGTRALLGRQAAWPPGRYSTIAGFVEPGESLEDAVLREILEETGVVVEGVEYHSSQPWPFPASLMLGFTARAVTTEVRRRDEELEDARWFTRDDLAAGAVILPPRQSISFSLIEHWFDSAGGKRLRELQGNAPWP